MKPLHLADVTFRLHVLEKKTWGGGGREAARLQFSNTERKPLQRCRREKRSADACAHTALCLNPQSGSQTKHAFPREHSSASARFLPAAAAAPAPLPSGFQRFDFGGLGGYGTRDKLTAFTGFLAEGGGGSVLLVSAPSKSRK